MFGTVAVKQTQFFALNGSMVQNQCAIGTGGATVFGNKTYFPTLFG